jgi:hypothetical protein
MNLSVVGGASRPVQTGRVLLYEQIDDVRTDGKNLMLNGTRFSKCASLDQADAFAKLIKQVAQEPVEIREKTIREFIAALFSKADALTRLEQASDMASEIRWTGLAFFMFLYVLVPVMTSIYGFIRFFIPVVAAMLFSASLVAVQYARAHKRLYPMKKSERIGNIVKMVLCPPLAIRAADLLSLEAISCFHPILVGTLLLGNDTPVFHHSLIRDLQYPLQHNHTDPQTLSIVSWYSAVERDAVTNFLKLECSTTFDDFFTPPLWDEFSTVYCPRCSCQFAGSVGDCPDCPGVGTLPISETKQTEGSI